MHTFKTVAKPVYGIGTGGIIPYDETVYPPLESVPKKFAISKRNEWMVLESNVIVAYVLRDFGGAAKTLQYARRKKKKLVIYNNDRRDQE